MTPPLRVRVVLPGDPYTGEVGTVERVISDDGGLVYVVRFGRWHTAYYRRDELTAA
jgi:hypothetical protein